MGADQKSHDWYSCVRLTLSHNKKIEEARERVNEAQSDVSISASAMLPRASGTARVSETDGTGSDPQSSSYSIDAAQLIFDAQASRNRTLSARKKADAARASYESVSSDVWYEIRNAFINVILSQELIKLSESICERKQHNARLVKLRYEAGREHRGSLLTSEADLAQAEYERGKAQRDASTAIKSLITSIGFNIYDELTFEGEFLLTINDEKTPDFKQIMETSPAVRNAHFLSESARFDTDAAHADRFPTLQAAFSARAYGNEWHAAEENEYTGALIMNVPFFEGGRLSAAQAKAESVSRQAQARLDAQKDLTLMYLESSWKEFLDARGALSVKEKYLAAAQERATIASAQYTIGLIGFDNWTIIENNLVSAQKAHLLARQSLLFAEARWAYAEGRTLEHDTYK